ncbi:MAG: hypothetical protein LBT50_08845, partial [Prevotellaceae bacterium]|nr:hypothetical protein [Prevotellaceae bacterium]
GGNGGVFYNWENETDRGYKTEFYNDAAENKLQYMEHDYFLTQIINYGNESTVILNGIEVQKNAYQISSPKGKIAIYHSPKDGKMKIVKIKVKPIDPLPKGK